MTLVVPLFDEAARLSANAGALLEFVGSAPEGSELVLVDDGSTDATVHQAERVAADAEPGVVTVLRRPHLGKGAAVRSGLLAARAPVAAFCDVDLATPLSDLRRLIDRAAVTEALVIGSRGAPDAHLVRRESPAREALGRTFNRAVRALLVPGVEDTQCGAKAARTDVWHGLLRESSEDGFAWDVEVLALAMARGIPVEEHGVTWSHDDRSRLRVVRDGARMVSALPGIRRRVRAGRATASRGRGRGGGVFAGDAAGQLAGSDAEHWWFRAKAELVSAALRTQGPRDGDLVDLGAGAGGVTARLRWPPRAKVAVEGNAELVELAVSRHGLRALHADIVDVPLEAGSAAAVCLLDVIEHLDDPAPALAEAGRLLRPAGLLVVTVPGHRWLWSQADVSLGHARRYDRRSLRDALARNGFQPVVVTHVFSWLVPPVWLRRRIVRRDEADLGLDTGSPMLDRTARVLTAIEARLVGRVALPFGTSVLAVAVVGR